MITPISLLAFTSTGLVGILAFYMWRKATANYTLLVETATTFDNIRRENLRLSETARTQFEELKQLRTGATSARSDADTARRDLADILERMQILETESRRSKERLSQERHQFITQLETANGQIEALKNRAADAQAVADLGLTSELKASQERASSLAQNLARTQAELTAVKAAVASELEAMHKTRRRNTQLERLYQSMRSLKIMAEERSTNWEHALKDLSTWTLNQQAILPAEHIKKMSLGELVGGALASIGKSLVEVDHEQVPSDPVQTEPHENVTARSEA